MKPVFLTAALSLDAGAIPRSFSGVAYSGGPVEQWGEALVIDLATLRVDTPIPLLHLHDHTQVVGAVTQVVNDGQQLSDSGDLFSDFDPVATGIAQRAARGIPYQQSLGLYSYSEERIPVGRSVAINNRDFTGPITVLRNGLLREITICPLGADLNTSAAFLKAHSILEEQPMADDPNAARVAELTAEVNGLRQVKSDLSQQVERAEQKVTALTAELETVKKAVEDARLREVRALFADVGKAYEEQTAALYLQLSAEAFAQFSEDLRAAHKKVEQDEALFSEQARGDVHKDKAALLSFSNIYATRREANV